MNAKKLIALLLLIVVALAAYSFAQDKPDGLDVEYDKFEDRTTVSTTRGRLRTGYQPFTVTARTVWEGEAKPEQPPELAFVTFRVASKRWIFLHNRDVFFIADGERIALGEATRASMIASGGVSESLSKAMEWATFKRIANAKTVEVKAGYLASEVPDKIRADWRALVQYAESSQ